MAGHSIYSPLSWQESLGYRASLTIAGSGKNKGKPQCRESVYHGRGGSSQCARAGTVCEEVNGEQMYFCAQHSTAEKEAREAAARAKWDAEDRARKAEWAALRNAPKFQSALEQIAAGHNDARGLAEEVLRAAGLWRDAGA